MYAIFTDDGLDQIVETRSLANREAKDLRAMGIAVRIVEGEESVFDLLHEKIVTRGHL